MSTWQITDSGLDRRDDYRIHELVTKRFKPSLLWDAEVQQYLEAALGRNAFSRVSEAICTPPLVTCVRVNTLRTSRETVAEELREKLATARPAEKVAVELHHLVPDALLVHGAGPREVDYSRAAGKEIIISRKAGEAVLRGAHVFVPGVLACSSGVERGELVAVSVALDNPKGRLTVHRGSVTEHLQNVPGRSDLYIGVGRTGMSRKEMFRERSGVAVTMETPVYQTLPCNGILRGKIMAQNLPSLVAAHVLAPKAGSRVCDMCAAPGGKTTALAQIMRNEGLVFAFDRSHNKVAEIQSLAEELGLNCISAHRMDAAKACKDVNHDLNGAKRQSAAVAGDSESNGAGLGTTQCSSKDGRLRGQEKIDARKRRKAAAALAKGQPLPKQQAQPTAPIEAFPRGLFAYVLLDAPCSALGLRPRLQQRADMELLRMSAAYQRKLLRTAVALLAPGGFLVYSTCTINPGENEANVRFVLDRFPEMSLAPQSPVLGGPGLVGSLPLGQEQWLTEEESRLVQRFDPRGDTIGFFIAKFKKTE